MSNKILKQKGFDFLYIFVIIITIFVPWKFYLNSFRMFPYCVI